MSARLAHAPPSPTTTTDSLRPVLKRLSVPHRSHRSHLSKSPLTSGLLLGLLALAAGSALPGCSADDGAGEATATAESSLDRDTCIAAAWAAATPTATTARRPPGPRPTVDRAAELTRAVDACITGSRVRVSRTGWLAPRVEADLAASANDLLKGRIDPRSYLALVHDRTGKLHQAEARGTSDLPLPDADGDRIPDEEDRCPDTPLRTPTDASGCPSSPAVLCARGDAACAGRESALDQAGRKVSGVFDGARILVNPKCDATPTPNGVSVIEWGRGPQPAQGTWGFNLRIERARNQTPGCEHFYEIEVRFKNPNIPEYPQVAYAKFVFRAADDLSPSNPNYVTFGLPMGVANAPHTGLSGRLGHYYDIRFRARAVNGAQKSSEWSEVRKLGTSPHGVTP